jgi:acetolactate synthase I/III small subunit
LALITVGVEAERRSEVVEMAGLFRGKVVDVAASSVMIEIAGTEGKIDALVELLRPYGIKELARTGVIAMGRGMQMAREEGTVTKPRTRSLNAPAQQALPPS